MTQDAHGSTDSRETRAAPRTAGADPAFGASLEGHSFGDYRVLSEVGRGGMGVVYLAEQISLGRKVALKVLPAVHALNPDSVEAFRREVHALAALQHPGIVGVYDAGDAFGRPFFAMEFVRGMSLADALGDARKLPGRRDSSALLAVLGISTGAPEPSAGRSLFAARARLVGHVAFAVQVAAEVADALAAVHRKGIVHRDIKPNNILLEDGRRPRLADFGLARLLGGGQAMSQRGRLAGTPTYMSPEQILANWVEIDHRTDIYSLGATLYELLTLRPPFDAKTIPDLFRQIQWDEPPPLRSVDPSIPADLERVVTTAMAKNPAHRYQDADQFAADLRRVLTFEAVMTRGTPRWSRVSRMIRRHRIRLAAASVVGVVLAASLAVVWAESRRQAEALDAIRRTERSRQLELLGRAEAALGAGRIGAALSALSMLGDDPQGLDESARADAVRIRRAAEAAVDAKVALARKHLDEKHPADAVAALAGTEDLPYRSDELRELNETSHRAAAEWERTRLFESASPTDRSLAIRAWRDDRLAGRTVEPWQDEAMRRILDTETSEQVLLDAVRAVSVAAFDAFDETLRRRFRTGSPAIARQIAFAAALDGRASWLGLLAERETELAAGSGNASIDAWDEFEYARGVQKTPRTDQFGRGFGRFQCLWLEDIDGSGIGSHWDSPKGLLLICRTMLRGPRLREDAEALLRSDAPGDVEPALLVLTELDDPATADALASADERAGSWDANSRTRAAELLARWRHPKALDALRALRGRIKRGEFCRAAATLVTSAFRQTDVQDWLRGTLDDPLTWPDERRALWTALTRADSGSWPRRHGPAPDRWAGSERARGTVVAAVWARLAESTKAQLKPEEAAHDEPVEDDSDTEATSKPADAAGPAAPAPAAKKARQWQLGIAGERAAFAASLASDTSPSAVASLTAMLRDPAQPVRRAAALALVERGEHNLAVGFLQEIRARRGPDPEIERALARIDLALGNRDAAVARVRALVAEWDVPAKFLDAALRDAAGIATPAAGPK